MTKSLYSLAVRVNTNIRAWHSDHYVNVAAIMYSTVYISMLNREQKRIIKTYDLIRMYAHVRCENI